MPTLIMDSSPKFITCPDCCERYDNARKRRLIDTCGHPRCYSCLFVDNPCPLCEKLPKQRQVSSCSAKESSNESLDKVSPNATNLNNKTVGSHPNLSELHKARSSTLPPSFRQDNYFRSLYRYEPHGSSESLSSRSSSPPSGRPRSMPPSYHVSIENLNEQFWKSVELAEKKWSPRRKNKETPPKNTKVKDNNSRPDVVECPAPDVIRLPVPTSTHPKSQLENHMRGREDRKKVTIHHGIFSEIERPRSFSDVENIQRCTSAASDTTDGFPHRSPRPLSWSPTQFPINSRTPSSISKSDRFSDSSSIYLSDTWSESSDSDSFPSSMDDKSSGVKNQNTDTERMSFSSDDTSQVNSPPRKYKANPLANVTYWVVDSGNSVEVHKGYAETDKATHSRPKPKVTHQWNGQTNHLAPKTSLVSVHTEVNTL